MVKLRIIIWLLLVISTLLEIFALLGCTQRILVVANISNQPIGPIFMDQAAHFLIREDGTDTLFRNIDNNQSTLGNIPVDGRFHLHHSGSLNWHIQLYLFSIAVWINHDIYRLISDFVTSIRKGHVILLRIEGHMFECTFHFLTSFLRGVSPKRIKCRITLVRWRNWLRWSVGSLREVRRRM